MILKVARLGHPVLRRPAEPVPPGDIPSPRIQVLIDDLVETMRDYSGVGIAANQAHVGLRIAAVEVRGGHPRYPEAPEIPLTVLVNLRIVERSPELEEDWEGCLSVPDLRGKVPRHRWVRAQAFDRHGRPLDLRAEGFFARVIQHECDHLDGKVYLDRMPDLGTLAFMAEHQRYWKSSDISNK